MLNMKCAKRYNNKSHRGRRRPGNPDCYREAGGIGFALIPIAIGILCTQAPIPLAFLFFKKKKVTMLNQHAFQMMKGLLAKNRLAGSFRHSILDS